MTAMTTFRVPRARLWLVRLGGAVAGGALALAVLVSPLLGLAVAVILGLMLGVAYRERLVPWLSTTVSGAVAVGIKELRGRMRGRRAFTILTLYLGLLAAFAWAVIQIQERNAANQATLLPGRDLAPGAFLGVGQVALGAQIGQTLFVALLVVLTIVVVLLAPAFTAGAISGERERQTFEMLAATPLTGTAVVVGKLFSALGYLFLLIVASIPLMSLVFTYGGVAVEDIVRAYVVLVASAVSFGALGLFLSALVRRTGAATILSYVAVLALTLASLFAFLFWGAMVNYQPGTTIGSRDPLAALGKRPPEALVWLDPALAVADLACSTSSGDLAYYSCAVTTYVTNTPYFGQPQTYLQTDVAPPLLDGVGFDDEKREVAVTPVVNPYGVPRDLLWPRIVASQLFFAVILTIASVLLVAPTRPSLGLPPAPRPRAGRDAPVAAEPSEPAPAEVAS